MANVQSGKMIVGLDIGTSKVVALVGEVADDGTLEIVGIGTHPSRGLKKGVVVNIESTVQSIQRAIEEAQLMAGCRIHSAFVGVAGNHIRSLNSHGIVAIRDREVSSADLERVLDAAQAVAIPADQRVLHTLPQDYVIDNQEGVREPWACPACVWKPRFTWSPAPSTPHRTLKSACAAAVWKSTTSFSSNWLRPTRY
jgi:cell division protein FtsA